MGNFDGLHVGHRALLEESSLIKNKLKIKSAVLTFDPHPLAYLTGKAPKSLISNDEKACYAREYFDVDRIIFIHFNQALADLEPEEFLSQALLSGDSIKHVVIGHNFTYGKYGAGNAMSLKRFCSEHNIGISVIPLITSAYGVVSSTAIRDNLFDGNLDAANAMLGYWYNFSSTVLRGRSLGRTLGFPTANLKFPLERQIPKNGVYAVFAEYQGEFFQAVANLGFRPTVEKENTQTLLEANLFTDRDLDLYGGELRIYFGKYLRPEKQFVGLDELKNQIAKDKAAAKAFLTNINYQQCLPKKVK
jgi:riboflavin kinase/FMN adenylyltransferase